MALLVILGQEEEDEKPPPSSSFSSPPTTSPRPNPNAAHLLSRLLSSYPLLVSLSRHLDYSDLHALVATCLQFHAELSPHRPILLANSLICASGVGGKWARCVRDLVNPCMRCRKPVCRNCTKKPASYALRSRLRWICLPHRSVNITTFPKRCECESSWFCSACAHSNLAVRQGRGCAVAGCAGEVGGGNGSGSGSGGVEAEARSWCGACDAVVLAVGDKRALKREVSW